LPEIKFYDKVKALNSLTYLLTIWLRILI